MLLLLALLRWLLLLLLLRFGSAALIPQLLLTPPFGSAVTEPNLNSNVSLDDLMCPNVKFDRNDDEPVSELRAVRFWRPVSRGRKRPDNEFARILRIIIDSLTL